MRATRRPERRLIALTGLIITVAMLLVYVADPPVVTTARNLVFDTYQRTAPRPVADDAKVAVVVIDEAALARFGQWPWPRSYLAALTNRLFDQGAVAVGYDLLFPEPDRTTPARLSESLGRYVAHDQRTRLRRALSGLPDHDGLFAEAMAGRPVVLAAAGADHGALTVAPAGIAVTGAGALDSIARHRGALAPIAVLAEAAAGLGAVDLANRQDGVVRAVPMVVRMGDALVPSLSAELLRLAHGGGGHVLRTSDASGEMAGGKPVPVAMRSGAFRFPLDRRGHLRLWFAAAGAAPVLPVGDILGPAETPATARAAIEGRIVLVGSSARGLHDLHATPLATDVPGVMLHAAIIEQISTGSFVHRPDWMAGLELVLVVIGGLCLTWFAGREAPLWGAGAAAGLATGMMAGGWYAFDAAGLLVDPSWPVLTLIAVLVPVTTIAMTARERARRAIRDRFAHFLPEPLIARIAANPALALTPEGASRPMTVMFVDMRRFSSVTEKMDPEDVVSLLNIYLGAVTDALVGANATIDKYIGDAVMAFWNAPIAAADHAADGIRAVFAVERAVAQANETLARRNLPRIEARIGLNTGRAFVGLMGSRNRLSYTCVGDSVTQAARFEGLTRLYGVSNCVGGDTVASLPEGVAALALDLVTVKGRSEPVAVHVLYDATDTAATAFARDFDAARGAFLERDWATATALFTALRDTGTAQVERGVAVCLYLERIAALQATSPPFDWDGSSIAASKR